MRKPLPLNHPERRFQPPSSPMTTRQFINHPEQRFPPPLSPITTPKSCRSHPERRFAPPPSSPMTTRSRQSLQHPDRLPPPLITSPKPRQRLTNWPPNTTHLPPTDSVYAQPYGHQLPSTSSSSQAEDFQPVKVIGVANINEKRDFTKIKKQHSKIRWYSNIIFNYPATVLAITLLLFCGLPLTILQIFPLSLDQNPEKGFDTRGTEYSNARLTWTKLQPFLTQGSRVIIHQPPPPLEELKIMEPLKILEERQKLQGMDKADNRSKRSFEDELAALSAVACYEFELLQMDYMAQLIIELSSYEKLFDLKMHRELCQLQHFLAPSFKPFTMLSPYRQIFHISNFAGCLSPLNRDNCTSLSTFDLNHFKIQLEKCFKSRKAIIQCGRDCIGAKEADGEERHNCQQCEKIPSNCTSQMWFDLFYRILPKDLMARKAGGEKIYVNSFLPLYTYSAYGFQGFNVSLSSYISLERDLKQWASNTKELKVKGYLLDIKRDILLASAISDSKLAIIAAAVVFLLVFLYSLSLGYTIAVFIELGASVFMAAAVYRGFSEGFPLLNLVSFVLLLSIGSDGAFLLFNAFPSKSKGLDEDTFDECLSHTITTMFLAQFSTIVPFLLNLISSVIVFRNFGLFAGLTLIFNYFLLITFLPAFLVFHRRFIDPFFEDKCLPSISKGFKILCFPLSKLRKGLRYLAFDTLPFVLIDGRFIWIGALSVLIILGGYSAAMQLRLPQYNPLQLFTANNPHEWYDNHAEKLFEFVAKKIALPLTVRLLWGFEKTPALSHFDSTKIANVSQDRRFELKTVEDVKRLADDMQKFRMLEFVGSKEKYWPERFLDWSKAIPCSEDITVCCNINSRFYSNDFLDYCLRVSTSQIPTGYNDTPIYHNISFDLVGYTAMIPTKLKYSHKFHNLSGSIELFDKSFISTFTNAMFYTTEWSLMSTWYDLQKSIISDCKSSVAISFAVVLVFAAIILKWKSITALITIASIVICTVGIVASIGWEIGVLEAIILALIVSLSFDYTLHYGAAIPSSGCAKHRLIIGIKRSIAPVTMATFSSILSGVIMLFSVTHAFFQVATFLIISGLISWLFSTFFFLPLIYLFLPKISADCSRCLQDDQEIINRRTKRHNNNNNNFVPMKVLRNRF